MTRLGMVAVRRPGRALLVAGVVLAAAVPGLLRLELRTDGAALVPPNDPAVLADAEIRRHFGLRDPLLVVLETDHAAGIFNPETLSRLKELTGELTALAGVDPQHVVSLATEHSPRYDPRTGGFLPLLVPAPTTPARLAEVREQVEDTEVAHGTLVSHDRRAAVVLIGMPRPDEVGADERRRDRLDRGALYRRIAAVAEGYAGGGHRVSVVGAPAAEALLGDHVLGDLALLIPLVMLVVGAVLWWACGRAAAAVVGLVKVGAAQLFTFGVIGWCGQPVYLTTAVIPVLLATVGIADELHLLWSFYRRPGDEPAATAIERTLRQLARPVVFTSLTTALGFLTFLASSIRPVASVGLFTAVGVLFSMLWSLSATPALMVLLPAGTPVRSRGAASSRWVTAALAPAAHRRWVLPALALGAGLLALGLPRLSVQDSWLLNFATDSPLRQASERADRLLAGTNTLHLALTFDPPPDRVPSIRAASGPLLSAEAVAAVGRFENALRERPEVGGVLGLASHLSTTSYLWGGGRHEADRALVDDPHWIYLHIRRLANVRGEARRRELIDDDFRRTVVTVLVEGADYRRTAALIEAVRRAEKELLAPVHARVDLAGDLAVSQAMIPAIVRTQVRSLLLAFAGCALIASLLFRSLWMALLAITPSALGLVCTLGILGWLGIPLGIATSMFCAVTLGIGIDYSIHLLVRFRAAQSAGETEAGLVALTATAPAILVDALAVILGFGLLAASQVPTNRWLGLAVAAALATSGLFTLAGTGGLLLTLDRRRRRAPGRALTPTEPSTAREEAG